VHLSSCVHLSPNAGPRRSQPLKAKIDKGSWFKKSVTFVAQMPGAEPAERSKTPSGAVVAGGGARSVATVAPPDQQVWLPGTELTIPREADRLPGRTFLPMV